MVCSKDCIQSILRCCAEVCCCPVPYSDGIMVCGGLAQFLRRQVTIMVG
jgi:hypothetical protein